MTARWIGVSVTITRFVSDSQPGIVEAEFCDIHGQGYRFTDKQSFFGRDDLDIDDVYPRPGVMLCWVRGRREDPAGREVVRVELYGEGIQVEVDAEALVEGTYDSKTQRPWSGFVEPNTT